MSCLRGRGECCVRFHLCCFDSQTLFAYFWHEPFFFFYHSLHIFDMNYSFFLKVCTPPLRSAPDDNKHKKHWHKNRSSGILRGASSFFDPCFVAHISRRHVFRNHSSQVVNKFSLEVDSIWRNILSRSDEENNGSQEKRIKDHFEFFFRFQIEVIKLIIQNRKRKNKKAISK